MSFNTVYWLLHLFTLLHLQNKFCEAKYSVLEKPRFIFSREQVFLLFWNIIVRPNSYVADCSVSGNANGHVCLRLNGAI